MDEICLRAYNSIYIQGICKTWKDDPDALENLSDEVIEVIENLKIEFPRLQRWDNIKIATRFCETWENTDTLRNERNETLKRSPGNQLGKH